MGHLPDTIAFLTDARAWGGAEVYLMQLLAAMRAVGVRSRVFCADRREADAWVEELERLGHPVERYRPTKEFNPLGYFIARKLLGGFELIHINKTDPRNSLPAVVAARLSGAKVVVATEHIALSPHSHFPMGRQIITFLVQCTNKLLDRTIAVSGLTRDMLIENYRIPPEKVVAIRNGMDVGRFDEEVDEVAVRAELGLSPDDKVAIVIGRFAAGKGHSYAIRAAKLAAARVPDLRMVLAGDGQLEDDLRAEAKELGVSDRVLFVGFRRDIPRLLAVSDVLVLPSEDESLPLVILEAMSSRLPVIATDVGGISEAVEDGRTGILVSPRDVGGLTDAMVDVLGDRERARAMGLEGRRKVETEFSLEACTAAVLDVYEELLSKKGRK